MTSAGRALLLACALLAAPAAADPPPRHAALEDAVPRGPSVDERMRVIRARVQAVLEYPPLARRRGVEGTSLVAFEIGGDGLARDVAIAASSGSPQLDRAAQRAVRDAGRLPYVYGRLEIPVLFVLER